MCLAVIDFGCAALTKKWRKNGGNAASIMINNKKDTPINSGGKVFSNPFS
jgi:hypothetical protein